MMRAHLISLSLVLGLTVSLVWGQTPIVDCGTPPSISNGSPGTPTRTTFEGTVTYTCNNGYQISPGVTMATAFCLATGNWGISTCLDVVCLAHAEEEYTVAILTDHNEPYRPYSGAVQFTCLLEPPPPEPAALSYQWKFITRYYGEQRSGQNLTFFPNLDNLRFCWFFCHVYSNDTLLSIGRKVVEVNGIFSSSMEPVQHYSNGDMLTMRATDISEYYSRFVHEVTWYHNGSEISSDERVVIGGGTYDKELNVTDLRSSDAGIYQMKVTALTEGGIQDPVCDSLLLPLLENHALFAPVTFTLRESTGCKIEEYSSLSLQPPIPSYYYVFQNGGELVVTETINLPVQLNITVLLDRSDHQWFHNGEAISSDGIRYNSTISVHGDVITVVLVIENITEADSGFYTLLFYTDSISSLDSGLLDCRYDRYFIINIDFNLYEVITEVMTISIEEYKPPVIQFSLSMSEAENTLQCSVVGGNPATYNHNITLTKNRSIVSQTYGDHLFYNSSNEFGVYTCIVESLHSNDNKTLYVPERVLPTIGFETNESRLREGDTVEVCLVVADGEVTSPISIAIFTGNTEGNFSSNLSDVAFAGRDYNTNPQTDLVMNETHLILSPGDQRVCFQVLSVNNSIPDSSVRQATFRFSTNITAIISPTLSHQLYILDDDVNCTKQVSVDSRLCVDLKHLSVACLEPALVCDYLVINCPDMSDELNCPSPLDGLVNSSVTVDNLGETVSQVSKFANISANGTLLQTEGFLSDISTVFENVADFVNSSNSTLNTTVISEIVSILDSLLRWNPDSLVVDSTSNLVQSFEVVASTFAQQANLSVDFMDVSFVAQLAPTESFKVSGSSVDFGNQVGSPASIILPPSLFNSVPKNRPSVGVFFALYQTPALFPITNQTRADNITTRVRTVGSVVLAATVGPGLTLMNIDPPVLITIGLSNPENISEGSESCVSWDFTSESWITEGCSTVRVDNSVECRCNHLTNFAVLVDICSRAQDCVSDPTVDTVLKGITLIGVVISCVGLIITIITLLAFRKLREKDNSKYHIQLSIAMLCLLIVFAAGIDKVQVYGGCIFVSILIHYFSLAAFMWIGAEALLMFQKLVIVFVMITKRYIVILSLVCWLIPIIPVLIPMIADLADGTTPETDLIITRNVNNETGIITGFCFLQHPGVFFGAFLGPIFAIILFNLVIFIWVIVVLIKHTRGQLKRSDQDVKPKTVIRQVISISGVMFLFGLTWLFGALTFSIAGNTDVRNLFRSLFVIFSSFQGFFIFLFFCVFNNEAREAWKEVLSFGKLKSRYLHPSQFKTFSGVTTNQKSQKATTATSLSLGRMTNQSDSLDKSKFECEISLLSMKQDLSKVQDERYSHKTNAAEPTSEVV